MNRCLSSSEELQIKDSIRDGDCLEVSSDVAINHLNSLELPNVVNPELRKDIACILRTITQTEVVLYEKCSPESLDPEKTKVYSDGYRVIFLDRDGNNVACKIYQRILQEALKNICVPKKSIVMIGSIFNENATFPMSAFLLNNQIGNLEDKNFSFISDFD